MSAFASLQSAGLLAVARYPALTVPGQKRAVVDEEMPSPS